MDKTNVNVNASGKEFYVPNDLKDENKKPGVTCANTQVINKDNYVYYDEVQYCRK